MSEISFEDPSDNLVEGIQSYKNRVYASVDEYACHQPASAIYREPLSRIFLSCPDPMFDRVEQMKTWNKSTPLELLEKHLEVQNYLCLNAISKPYYTGDCVIVSVRDHNYSSSLLMIQNWSLFLQNRRIKSQQIIEYNIDLRLPINSKFTLFNPHLIKQSNGNIALLCTNPDADLFLHDFQARCTNRNQIDIDQLIRWANAAYQVGNNEEAIEFLTYGLRQLDEKPKEDLFWKEYSPAEYERYRVPLLHNRCMAYIQERQLKLALDDLTILQSLTGLSPSVCESVNKMEVIIYLQMGDVDIAKSLIQIYSFDDILFFLRIMKEIHRLEQERIGKYDLQGMLQKQGTRHRNGVCITSIFDLRDYHLQIQPKHLFQIRPCSTGELIDKGYPKHSYGVYALQTLRAGSLLLVEAPFACIDRRYPTETHFHSIEQEKTDEDVCLLNETQKQLLIGGKNSIAFDKINLMQPIREWLNEMHMNYFNDHRLDEPFFTDIPTPGSIPRSVVYATQQQNPFQSKYTRGWYPTGSMFNHSCLPNCLWYVIDDHLFVYVCGKDIQPREELTISYCPLWISPLEERTFQLRKYGIYRCRCKLCSFDRIHLKDYGDELKEFSKVYRLAKNKYLSREECFHYVQKLSHMYQSLVKKSQERPIGFINEFVQLEDLINSLQDAYQNEIGKFFKDHQRSFLQRFSNLCRFSIANLPDIDNPIVFFGRHLQLLVRYIARMASNERQLWYHLFEKLYRIFTFNSCSSTSNTGNILIDLEELLTHLDLTQTVLEN